MKKIALAASVAAMALMASNTALAADGTIIFTGEVTTSTCVINSNDANQTVALPKVTTGQLSSALGATAGRRSFQLRLTGCTTDTTTGTGTGATTTPAPVKKVSVAFEPGANVNTVTGRLKPAGAKDAKNVEIAILNDTYEQIFIGANPADSKSQFVDIDTAVGGSGAATLNFSAEYVSTGVVTTGPITTSVSYTLAYQ